MGAVAIWEGETGSVGVDWVVDAFDAVTWAKVIRSTTFTASVGDGVRGGAVAVEGGDIGGAEAIAGGDSRGADGP